MTRERPSTLAALALAPRTTVRAHADAGFPLRDLRLCQPWTPGPSAGSPGPHLLSVNEYRPHRVRDVLPIARVTAELVRDLRTLDGCCGVVTAYALRGLVTCSLSIWSDEEALRRFTVARPHREVMRTYRTRGYLRHVHWWGQFTTIGAGMAEATRRLDAGEGRRVGEARDRWARRDQARLARLAAAAPAPASGSERQTA
jgi:heme-degrading monooxygenase HmoA